MLAPFVLLAGIFEPVQMAVICAALPVCAVLSWNFRKSEPGPKMNSQLVRTALAQALLGALICVAAML
jgi:1,4-dihydroxy-2-naphthoate octaprenyltransferase